MSYDTERLAITRFIRGQNYFGLSPFGLDGESAQLEAGSGFMTLLSGEGRRVSVGSPGANLHRYANVLMITALFDAERSSEARQLADQIVDAFTGKKLDETGAEPSVSSVVILNFEMPDGSTPYMAESRAESPYHRVVVNAPFIRTERK